MQHTDEERLFLKLALSVQNGSLGSQADEWLKMLRLPKVLAGQKRELFLHLGGPF